MNRKVIDKDIKKTEREKRRQTEKDRKGEKRDMEMELGESEISETWRVKEKITGT